MSQNYYMLYNHIQIFEGFESLCAVETTRQNGVSPKPFSSLNLGNFTEDLAENINQNQALLLDDLRFEIDNFATAKQVHGHHVTQVDKGGTYSDSDALISNTKGILLGITIADCTPILIYDAENQAIAAIHAGWRGTVGEIIIHTLKAMNTAFGTKPNQCFAYVGTCISLAHFEVGDEVAEQFESHLCIKNIETNKYHVNLKQANYEQLRRSGIPHQNIEVSSFCTIENNDLFFSYRAENGVTGRFMGLIGLR